MDSCSSDTVSTYQHCEIRAANCGVAPVQRALPYEADTEGASLLTCEAMSLGKQLPTVSGSNTGSFFRVKHPNEYSRVLGRHAIY